MEHKKRYHIDNSYFSSPLVCGPVNVYQVCDLACSYDYEVGAHKQICHEISYIVDGEGVFTRDGVQQKVKKGDLFVVSKGDVHSLRSSRDYPLHYRCIGFTFNRSHAEYPKYEALAAYYENCPETLGQDTQSIYRLFSGLVREIYAPGPMGGEMVETYVRQIVIATHRTLVGAERISERSLMQELGGESTNPLIFEMMRLVEQTEREGGELSDIAGRLGYSYCYLSRLFSGTMGYTLRQHYNNCRFDRAAGLLTDGATAAATAECLGFADTSTFCKAFKRHFGITPSEYKNK